MILEKDQQERAREQYVGRLSRLKKSTYTNYIEPYPSYPLSALENIEIADPILADCSKYKTYKSPVYEGKHEQFQRTRIHSYKHGKTII